MFCVYTDQFHMNIVKYNPLENMMTSTHETLFLLLAICEANPPVTAELSLQMDSHAELCFLVWISC